MGDASDVSSDKSRRVNADPTTLGPSFGEYGRVWDLYAAHALAGLLAWDDGRGNGDNGTLTPQEAAVAAAQAADHLLAERNKRKPR